ncbi:MAG: hypothetical protein IJM59_10765 [Proteobacteria bacterium]|nr:hypothetical protein [Pseudomonadota bacterium]
MRHSSGFFVYGVLFVIFLVVMIMVVICIFAKRKKQKGPWSRKDYLTKRTDDDGWGTQDQWGSGSGFDQWGSGSDAWGANSGDDGGKSSKFKLNLIHFIMAPLSLLGVLTGLGGFIIAASGCPDKHSHKAHPLLADSSLVSIAVGIGVIIVSFIIWSGVSKLKSEKNIIFKKNIIQKELMQHFYIHEYIYNQEGSGQNVYQILRVLKIAENSWNTLDFNDYFSGKYKDTPFLFLDCELKEKVGSGKQSRVYERFIGQVLILKYHAEYNLSHRVSIPEMPEPLHFSGTLAQVSNILDLNCPLDVCIIGASNANDFENMIGGIEDVQVVTPNMQNMSKLMDEIKALEKNGDIDLLTQKCAELNRMISSTNSDISRMNVLMQEIEMAEKTGDIDLMTEKCAELNGLMNDTNQNMSSKNVKQSPSEFDVEQYIHSISGTLNAVANAAECNTSFIFSGKYLAIILNNKFDPFEFGTMDTFRSYRSLYKRVQGEVHWLTLIFEALEKGKLLL